MKPLATLSESRIENGLVFARLMWLCGIGGASFHLVFLLVFAWHGWDGLALLNVASVLLYLGIVLSLRRGRRDRLMASLAVGELVVHAVVATLTLGWSAGFHLYLLGVVPILFIGSGWRSGSKWAAGLGLALGYAVLRGLSHHHLPEYDAPLQALRAMEYVNIVAMVLILTLGAHLHFNAVVLAERALIDIASTDPLTGLANRREWLRAAQLADRELQGRQRPYAVLLGDLDHFKSINDRHGHAGGDEALQCVARVLAAALRGSDRVGRWGGEEFAVLLPGCRQHEAVGVAEELRRRVGALQLELDGQTVRLSMTLGAAEALPGEQVHQVMRRADAALYRGKLAGRNRVEPAQAPHTPTPTPGQA